MPKIKGPSAEIKVGKQYEYIDLPSSMDECFYDLELKEVKELDSGNIAFVWKILDTDTKHKPGKEINLVLYPFQKLASVYFFRELITIYLVLKGVEVNQENFDAHIGKWKTILKKLKAGKFCMTDDEPGHTARVRVVKYENDKQEEKTKRIWEMGDDES